jgi:hypothetical protein
MSFHRRNEFSSTTKREAFDRSGGICEAHRVPMLPVRECKSPLVPGNIFYEHIAPDALNGLNDLSNCACLCKTHWRLKTATYDLPVIAKNNRQRDRNRSIKPQHYAPIVGTKRSGWKHSCQADGCGDDDELCSRACETLRKPWQGN